jgi:hypothetical protein
MILLDGSVCDDYRSFGAVFEMPVTNRPPQSRCNHAPGRPGRNDLSLRQRLFVEAFLLDLNGSAAARRAGYSPNTAHVQGSRLLRNVKVREAIANAMRERSERTKMDQDYALRRLAELVEDMGPGSSHLARVNALGLLMRHLGMLP